MKIVRPQLHRLLVNTAWGTLAILLIAVSVSAQSMFDKQNDYDGDGKADFAITRAVDGKMIWHIWQTTAGYRVVQWGLESDAALAGDYDGDGKSDPAVARALFDVFPTTMDFYVLSSQTQSLLLKRVSTATNAAGVDWVQDYDGDGRTDPAILTGQTTDRFITYMRSTTGTFGSHTIPDGQGITRVGDMDGDGTAEIAFHTFNPRFVTWRNPANANTQTVRFGLSADIQVPADFDGDGKGDLTIFRPSTGDWWWIRSSDNIMNAFHWGSTGDIPVPADYDGDGKTDQAVIRPASPNSIYYYNGSQTGPNVVVWGLPSDDPILY